VHDLFIDRDAKTGRESPVTLECGDGMVFPAEFFSQSVKLVGCQPRLQALPKQIKGAGHNLIRLEHDLNLVRRLDDYFLSLVGHGPGLFNAVP